MNKYQHYSFDLWLTLIRSNPAFKQERARFFHQNFNYRNKSLEEVTAVFRQVDVMCNTINEVTGKNIDADEMYLMVISMMNDGHVQLHDFDTDGLYDEMTHLLSKHLPVVYCDKTPKVLEHIKQNGGSTISILSNTGFIKGQTLRGILQQLHLDTYFDFQLYSDETGMSKPNKEFFKLMLINIPLTGGGIVPNRVIHIGDNPRADVGGAQSVGIQSLLINSNNVSIYSLINS
ncbi:HAD family hydrolase [Mucilaginibacter sp. Bleaf8]|uniref:HAD family hydrolase n=1 Tax=Mucilaginibacter sp. Bleaf8 TaxID=2834430 RepID=UPI001BCE8796|nr:HAD family hydrolase [Mucilaginibacter sp. Bleaf8]MBS7564973.1 HAD family hydrolase [Mucilaginibacter sp. Bleaf8]